MPYADNSVMSDVGDETGLTRRGQGQKGSVKKLTRQTQVEKDENKRRDMLKQESKDSGIVTEMVVRPKDLSPSVIQKEYHRSETSSSLGGSKRRSARAKVHSDKMKRSQSVKEKRHLKDPIDPLKGHAHDDLEIELLTPKQNGTVEDDQDKKSASTIRGMWKKAFKTLKSSSSVEKLTKKSSFSKKKQSSKEADDEVEQLSGPVDPVYSLLKCAADLPRSGGKSPCLIHPHCSGQHTPSYVRYPSGGDSSGNTSKTSSPSSSDFTAAANPDVDSLGSDFKNFYKISSPAKKKTSAFDPVLPL